MDFVLGRYATLFPSQLSNSIELLATCGEKSTSTLSENYECALLNR